MTITMASTTQPSSSPPQTTPDLDPASIATFQSHLATSTRIVAILGAGLSASSGLPTFRATNGLWHNHDVHLIATPAGWRRDPGLVWQFYSDRRRDALRAVPNPAHFALAELARRKEGFVALSQNVDGLLQRAGFGSVKSETELTRRAQLKLLHGNLFDLACAEGCGYVESDNFEDPLCPVLGEDRVAGRAKVLGANVEEGAKPPKVSAAVFEGIAAKNRRILGEEKFAGGEPTAKDAMPLREAGEDAVQIPDLKPALLSGIDKSELPQCPGCKSGALLRPRVVWFGEALPQDVVADVDALFEEEKIDLCLVIGMSSLVWPTAGFAEQARKRGARVAWVNMDVKDTRSKREEDWVFLGDAAVVLSRILGV